jgi:Flp pilus assembly protein TadD
MLRSEYACVFPKNQDGARMSNDISPEGESYRSEASGAPSRYGRILSRFHGLRGWAAAVLLLCACALSAELVREILPVVCAASSSSFAAAAGTVVTKPDALSASVTVDYPKAGSIFPPEITSPEFLWRESNPAAKTWRIEIAFSDGRKTIETVSQGKGMQIGEIDKRCMTNTNKLPFLTPEQAAAHTWRPDAEMWENIKQRSKTHPATMTFVGLDEKGHSVSQGHVQFSTSKDPVGAPIFYRDVPMSPSIGAKQVIQPIEPSMMYLIGWRMRDISKTESRLVMHDLPTCANCHSFSGDGKTMGMDVDGPANDKGLYAVVKVQKQMAIRNEDTIAWNSDLSVVKSRVGFMSQVSPDGSKILTTVAGLGRSTASNYYVANYKDYRFLQVFYPTRGILVWYDRKTGRREPLPGADDPRYVQSGGVWSPDGKYIVFARAEAKDPYSAGQPQAQQANDPGETQIQYSLYRIPFNDGKGGVAEPIAGASNNGMSNNFPKISPDGRWIVFVKCRNGQLMRPDSELYMVPSGGGVARRMNANTSLMNSWHSFSPNGRWLVFSSKSRSPYTQMYLTHIDENGNDSPPILIENSTAANRAVNIPEFVNIPTDAIEHIDSPAADLYRVMDEAEGFKKKGDSHGAIAQWMKALEMDPENARANYSLGYMLLEAEDAKQAIPYLKKATELREGYVDAQYGLGSAYFQEHRLDDAIHAWETVIRFQPDHAAANEGLGDAYYMAGNYAASLKHLRLALDGKPDSVPLLTLMASLLATCPDAILRNGPEAVLLADRANQLTQEQNVSVLDTLSAAYAECKHFDQAIRTAQRALDLASKQGDTSLSSRLTRHLQSYRIGTPLRDSAEESTL